MLAPPRGQGAPRAPQGRDGDRQRSRTPAGRRQYDGSAPAPGSPAQRMLEALLPPPPPLPLEGPMPERMPGFAAASLQEDAATSPADAASVELPRPTPLSPRSTGSDDPLADLVGLTELGAWAPVFVDPMAAEVEAYCIDALSQPLSFDESSPPEPQLRSPSQGRRGSPPPGPSPLGPARRPSAAIIEPALHGMTRRSFLRPLTACCRASTPPCRRLSWDRLRPCPPPRRCLLPRHGVACGRPSSRHLPQWRSVPQCVWPRS
jgi:hypothetical protein